MVQPKINWWPRNLRPYESRECFLARFSALNGITIHQASAYFRNVFDQHHNLTTEEIAWFADQLREPLRVVQTVLAPTVLLDTFGEFGTERHKLEREVRYCPQCAALGYHSSLHELKWLSKCVFHGDDLKHYWSKAAGSVVATRTGNLQDLLAKSSSRWTRTAESAFELDQGEIFEAFMSWVSRVRAHASFLHRGSIWSLDSSNGWADQSEKQIIGQLHAFVPVPEAIRPLFAPFDDRLAVEIRTFPASAKNEVTRFSGNLRFAVIYQLFKYICSYAPRQRPFNSAYIQARQELTARHGECKCEWFSYRNFGQNYWDYVGDGRWGRFSRRCPYTLALEELATLVGQDIDADTPRLNARRRDDAFRASRDLKDLELIGYLPNVSTSPEGYGYWEPHVWPCFEWVDRSMLTELCDAIAEFEVAALNESLLHWLDHIEAGGEPEFAHDLRTHIYLHATDACVTLIRWRRLETTAQC